MRLDKRLADAGLGTRSEVKDKIRKGQITVNGAVCKDAGMQLKDGDEVMCQGKLLSDETELYFMFHKPAGCVSATSDNAQTVLDYFPKELCRNLFPVGRLDKDTEGLLLLTSDGVFSHNLMSPKKHMDKTYYFEGTGVLLEHAKEMVQSGMDIGDEKPTLPAQLTILTIKEELQTVTGTITIHEGRYHQVKRMLYKLGVTITYLKRLSIGAVSLDETLEKGQYRPLTGQELMLLGKK